MAEKTYNITLTANHQALTAEYLPLAAESVQYLTAKVVCETEDWTGREIKAMFGQGCTVYEVPVTGGEITAKQQLNLTAGDWRVWLVGNSARDGDVIPRITTNVAHISVAPTGGTEGNPFPATPPTVEEQLRADMGNLADLTTEDKSSLVAAINEAAESGGSEDAVTYTPQTLTEEQKSQARTNIGAEKAGTAYTKPASGIPKSDLADDVQTSLAKADTAISLGLTAATPGQIIKVKTVQDGKPTEWEAVDMPSQTDWNQNDESAPDYVKNRPFYTGDPVEMVLVEESSVSFALSDGFYNASFPTSFNAEFGQTYKISWDGTVYECTCKDFRNLPIIGNQSIMGLGSDTGEPFIIFNETGLNETRWVSLTTDTSASHTISISGIVAPITKIDEKYLSELPYMDKENPTGTGSFSLNRKPDTYIGSYSFAEGYHTTASKRFSHAEGDSTTASGDCSHAEGAATTASGYSSHAEGDSTTASSYSSHAEGASTTASGNCSHAEGDFTTASSYSSHAEGRGTKASSQYQHVHGKYNIEDTSDTYAEIIGNGTSNSERSNAATVDWSGNAWYAGTVEGKALILPSSTSGSTKKFKITVDDSGVITATEVT